MEHKIGEIFNNFEILGEFNIKNPNGKHTRCYKLKCLSCEFSVEKRKGDMERGRGCPICSNRKIVKGYNDFNTIYPNLSKYLKNIEDGFNISPKSNKTLDMKCPLCGYEKKMKIETLVEQGFGCKLCGTKRSFAERTMDSFLNFINVKYETEKVFDWSDNKRYDFYIKENSLIIEMHGAQHYRSTGFSYFGGRTLAEEQENDKNKIKLAENNGIKNYISIDCSNTDFKFVINNIINSNIINVLDVCLSDIDIEKIIKNIKHNNDLIDICEMYKSGTSTREISKELNINISTVERRLHTGKSIGIIDYFPELESRKNLSINRENGYSVSCDGKSFKSIKECSKYYDIKYMTMYSWLSGANPMPKIFKDMKLRKEV